MWILNKPRVLITMGDPSGIGPEVISKALSSSKIASLAEFTVIGDKRAFKKFEIRNSKFEINFIDLSNVPHKNFRFGKVDPRYGKASFEYLELAVKLIKEKKADCLITAPLDKEAVNKAGIDFNGHTEYLANAFRVKDFIMMLIVNNFRFSLVTRHIAIKDVSKNLTKQNIFKAISLTNQALKNLFGIKKPRIGICALNPHASDGGLFGNEERKIINLAVTMARKKKYLVSNPGPADSIIKELVKEKKFDALISMYHDQALIPLKILGHNQGVNLTCGLPFIRTTPLHGVAFDIAGHNVASSASMIEAIKLAVGAHCNVPLQHRQ